MTATPNFGGSAGSRANPEFETPLEPTEPLSQNKTNEGARGFSGRGDPKGETSASWRAPRRGEVSLTLAGTTDT